MEVPPIEVHANTTISDAARLEIRIDQSDSADLFWTGSGRREFVLTVDYATLAELLRQGQAALSMMTEFARAEEAGTDLGRARIRAGEEMEVQSTQAWRDRVGA